MDRESFNHLNMILCGKEPKKSIAGEVYRNILKDKLITNGKVTDAALKAMQPYKVKNAIIMAAGLSSRFAPISYEFPKALIKVKGEVLIERQIRQLKEAGIDDITVVVGYKKELFYYLVGKYNVKIVENPEFSMRNNNSTLYYVRDILCNTYICSADNYFIENVFEQYVKDSYYSAIFHEGRTSEWCITTDEDGLITDVVVGGHDSWVMLGHAFFSEDYARKFVELLERIYEEPETKPLLWESIYIKYMSDLPMYIRKYPKDMIFEFDTLDELRVFDQAYLDYSGSEVLQQVCRELKCKEKDIIKSKPFNIDGMTAGFTFLVNDKCYKYLYEEKVISKGECKMSKEDLGVIIKLCDEKIKVKEMENIRVHRLGGLTNKNYKVETDVGSYVIRLPGKGTEELINRRDEHLCTDLVNQIDIDAKLIYFDDKSGIKISQHIDNAETMNYQLVRGGYNMKAIAGVFKKLHTCGKSVPVIFDVFEKIEEYESLLKGYTDYYFWEDYQAIKEQVYRLRSEIESMNVQRVMCHNDPLCENFIRSGDKMYLVDWEYAGMNDPMWDLADFFIEAELTHEEEIVFCNFYFGEALDTKTEQRIIMNKIFLDFLWSLWGKQRYASGEDLLEYANNRYERAKNNLSRLNAIK